MRRPPEVWFIYLIRTGDGALYAGITTDMARRLAEHGGADGRGAKYLRGRGPLQVVYQVEIGSHNLALKVERLMKRLPKPKKEAIVASAPGAEDLLRRLALDEA
jgi:putative endonuclease